MRRECLRRGGGRRASLRPSVAEGEQLFVGHGNVRLCCKALAHLKMGEIERVRLGRVDLCRCHCHREFRNFGVALLSRMSVERRCLCPSCEVRKVGHSGLAPPARLPEGLKNFPIWMGHDRLGEVASAYRSSLERSGRRVASVHGA